MTDAANPGPGLRSATRRLAARLPAPRGEALLQAGRALRQLITGRGAGPLTVLLQRVDAALDSGDAARAYALLEPALGANPWRRDLLERRARTQRMRGDAAGLLGTLARLHQVTDGTDEQELRRVAGLVVSTEPGWTPWLGGRRARAEPSSPVRVVHLLLSQPGSGPAADETVALAARIEAERAAGLDALVVAADLGTGSYPADAPLTDAIRDQAWLAARAVSDTRPALVCIAGPWYAALVGLAVRDALGTAVAVERCDSPPAGMLGGSRAVAARARSLEALEAAGDGTELDPRLADLVTTTRARAGAGRPGR
jgi:hypothetical protein